MVSPERPPSGDGPRPLGLATRAGMRLRHARRIAREVSDYGAAERMWWLVPFAVLLALFAAALVTTQTVVPVAVYTLF